MCTFKAGRARKATKEKKGGGNEEPAAQTPSKNNLDEVPSHTDSNVIHSTFLKARRAYESASTPTPSEV